jgi:hypothetical protein
MSRYGAATIDAAEWVRVSHEEPCPVCGAASECRVLEDGEFACCCTTTSEWPILTDGWLHRLPD